MEQQIHQFKYSLYDSESELPIDLQALLQQAKEASINAYAPYSKFRVGAAILLSDGNVLVANNQENASYPVGVCAERTLLSFTKANYPTVNMLVLAVCSPDAKHLLSPCGLCRQSILEYELLQDQPIKILLKKGNQVVVVSSASDLLPLQFNKKML